MPDAAEKPASEHNLRNSGTSCEPDIAETTDHDLIADVVSGSQQALAALYDRFGRRVYSLARRICVDEGLAEDVVQEVFITVWKTPHKFDPRRGSLNSWILVMAHHKAVDAVRRESAATRRTVPQIDAEGGSEPSGPGADIDALNAVVATQVRAALGQLPSDQRRALTLAYFGGYTQAEVASLTGTPLGTVKSRMFAGMKRLRSLLESTLHESDSAPASGGAR